MESEQLLGAYRVPFDVNSVVSKLSAHHNDSVWETLWENLYHQGDIGEASLYFVSIIAEKVEKLQLLHDWNPVAMVVAIDMARTTNGFSMLPGWVSEVYVKGIAKLSELVTLRLSQPCDHMYLKCALAFVALKNGHRDLAKLIFEVDEGDESRALELYFSH